MLLISYVPIGHASHVNVLVFLDPAAHAVHVPALLSPQPVRIWPSGHGAQAAQVLLPVWSWNTLLAPEHSVAVVLPSHR
jgi:hypothetical protein